MENRVNFLLRHCTGKGKVLHIGCGNSALHTILLGKLGKRLHGLDIYDYSEVYPRFLQGKAEELPYKGSSFDTVILGDVLMHVESHEKALQEAKRVLAPGGSLLVTAPNFGSLWNRLFRTYGGAWKIWLRQRAGGRGEKPKTYVYKRKTTAALLEEWIEKAGLIVAETKITHMTEDVACLFDTGRVKLQRGTVMDMRKVLCSIVPESLREQICINAVKRTSRCKILIAMQRDDWTRAMLEDLAAYPRFGELWVTARPHPAHSAEETKKWAAGKGWKNVGFDSAMHIQEAIYSHNITMTVSSTVGLEALLLQKLLVVYSTKKAFTLDNIFTAHREKQKPFFIVKSREELHALLDDYLAYHFGKWEGLKYVENVAVL